MSVNFVLYRQNKSIKKYMYEKIKNTIREKDKKIVLIVPEQYTLEAERETLDALHLSGMMDIEVLSFTRLMHKILENLGGSHLVPVREYGKNMILFKILHEINNELAIFNNMASKHGFVELANKLIREIKQSNITPEKLAFILEEMEKTQGEEETVDSIVLKKKIKDISLIYKKFHNALEKKYVDSEDMMNLAISRVKHSSLFENTTFWIDGFDYFNPQMLAIIEQIFLSSQEVYINLTLDSEKKERSRDLFYVTQKTLERCIEISQKLSKKYNIIHLDENYSKKMLSEIKHLEEHLFQYPLESYKEVVDAIEIYGCSSYAYEVETIATKIIELVKEKKYRFRDIAIICNDPASYNHVVKRLFEEYDIPLFIDDKKSIMRNPFIESIVALLNVVAKGYRQEDIFRYLKAGQSQFACNDYEKLENYAIKYHLKGNKWKKNFITGKQEYDEESFEEINRIRKDIIGFFQSLENRLSKVDKISEKTRILYDFLKNDCSILERIEGFMDYLRGEEDYLAVRQTAQIWNLIVSNLDQMVELIGNVETSNKEYVDILQVGFESIEVGIIPTTVDEVIIGNVTRSRIGQVKALFILGMNEGIIPGIHGSDGILLEEEKELLKKYAIEIGETKAFRIKEEKLLLYKLFTQPQEYLCFTYSVSDIEGKEIKPSIIIGNLKSMFDQLTVKKDIGSQPEAQALIYTPKSTLKHFVKEMGQAMEGKEIDSSWKQVHNWYILNQDYQKELGMISKGLFHEKDPDRLAKDKVAKLYDEKVMSPSRIEAFASCPQLYFLKYGMGIEERKRYEIASLEMGSIYHSVLMEFSKNIQEMSLSWEFIDYEKTSEIVEKIIKDVAKDYWEGIFKSDKSNAYRLGRMQEVLKKTAWILVQHIQKGNFEQNFYEASFGRKGLFPPIEVLFDNGERVYIEGRIDRVDLLKKNDGIYVKVIDYKTGGKEISLDEMINGLQIQLILYLNAAMEGLESKNKGKTIKPAGMFYFKIDKPLIQSERIGQQEDIIADIEKEIRKKFKMDGIILKDVDVIREMDKGFEKQSDIIGAKLSKDGNLAENNKIFDEEQFAKVNHEIMSLVKEICYNIWDGDIGVKPKRIDKQTTSCTYCIYKTVCMFDETLEDSYQKLKEFDMA